MPRSPPSVPAHALLPLNPSFLPFAYPAQVPPRPLSRLAFYRHGPRGLRPSLPYPRSLATRSSSKRTSTRLACICSHGPCGLRRRPFYFSIYHHRPHHRICPRPRSRSTIQRRIETTGLHPHRRTCRRRRCSCRCRRCRLRCKERHLPHYRREGHRPCGRCLCLFCHHSRNCRRQVAPWISANRGDRRITVSGGAPGRTRGNSSKLTAFGKPEQNKSNQLHWYYISERLMDLQSVPDAEQEMRQVRNL